VKSVSPRGETMYWIGAAGPAADAGEGTDFHAVEHGWVSVTPLQIDLTHAAQMGSGAQPGSTRSNEFRGARRHRHDLAAHPCAHGRAPARPGHSRDSRVLHAMGLVPRHIFLEPALANRAYDDTALPLGFGQTISQPFVVARMIEILIAGRDLGKTLEIGAGCGYQAAILGVLSKQVFAVERIAPLLARARDNLKQIKLSTCPPQARRWQSWAAGGGAV
jgi:hypothetical protein